VNNDSVAKNITCKSGTRCASGRCIKSACSDTDDGIDFTIEGTASANSVEMTDECINRHVLREYYCYGNGIVSVDEDCGSGMVCDDGTCVED
jgi:hypothetical protein